MTLIFVVEQLHNDTIIMKTVFTKSFSYHIFGHYYVRVENVIQLPRTKLFKIKASKLT